MIFDSHCHAWRRWPYDAAVPDPGHRGSVEALLYEMDRNDVERAAVVCARIGHEVGAGFANDDNNDYVADAARRHPDRLVTVADVDCSWRPEHHTPGAADRLRTAADHYGLTAFTHYVRAEDDGWFGTDDGREFFATAARLDLVASLAVSPAWFGSVRAVAAAHPTMPILLHHQGVVGHVPERRARELAALVALADLPNIHVKVSGFHYLSTPAWDFPFTEARTEILRPIADAFGPDRLMWGSDFPASRMHVTYTQTLSVVRDHTPWWDDEQRGRVLGRTLERVLRERRPLVPAAGIPTAG